MYTVDIHLKGENVASAISNLHSSIKLARSSKERLLCVIVGYGSTGGTHKIKTAVLEELQALKSHNKIRDYILGSELDIFKIKYQQFKGKALLDRATLNRRNPGEIIIYI